MSGSGSGEIAVLGVIGDERTGVSYVRFEQPFRHLRQDGFRLRTLGADLTLHRTSRGCGPGPELLEGVDLVVFRQAVAAPQMPVGAPVRLVEAILEGAGERGATEAVARAWAGPGPAPTSRTSVRFLMHHECCITVSRSD